MAGPSSGSTSYAKGRERPGRRARIDGGDPDASMPRADIDDQHPRDHRHQHDDRAHEELRAQVPLFFRHFDSPQISVLRLAIIRKKPLIAAWSSAYTTIAMMIGNTSVKPPSTDGLGTIPRNSA